jgi:cytoskeletal protein CcmA (bactofilin family)
MPAKRPQAKSRIAGRRSAVGDESGYTLLWVIFGFVVMGSIAAAALLGAGIERQSAKAVADWGTNLYVAEAGLQDVLTSVPDSALDGLIPGDSLVFGPTTLAQGGTYRGVLHRVDNGGQRLYQVMVEGRRRGSRTGGLRLAVLTERAVPAPDAAVSVAGDLLVSGSPRITGTCGGISVGGRLTVTGELAVEGDVAATDILVSGGSIVTPTGQKVNLNKQNSTPQDVPDLNTDQTCGAGTTDPSGGGGEYEQEGGEWEYEGGGVELESEGSRLETEGGGYVTDDGLIQLEGGQVAMPACADTGCTEAEKLAYYDALNAAGGVTHDGSKYVMDGSAPTEGTLCADDDVIVSGELGSETVPEQVSILSEGSVEISGNPYLTPHAPDGMLIQADGDLKLNGNSTLSAPNFGGDVYALGQCEVSGAPAISGQVTCANQPNPVGSTEIVVENKISGDALIHYDCPSGGSGGSALSSLRPISRRAWRQIY